MAKIFTLSWFLALAFTSMAARADDVRNAQALRQVDADTRVCVHDAVKVLVMQGARDSEDIANFAVSSCGGPMRAFAASVKEWPKDTVNPMLRAMAYNEMLKFPGLVSSPEK